jgi:hypothetical protein
LKFSGLDGEVLLKPRLGSAFEAQGVGHAEVDQGAVVATAFLVTGSWSGSICEKLCGSCDDLVGKSAEVIVDLEGRSASGLAIKDEPPGDCRVKHFFKTKGLGTDLDFIGPVGLRFAAFVLDRGEDAVAVFLDDVANSAEVVFFRTHPELPQDRATGPVLVRPFVGFFVEELTFGSESVFRPNLLVVNESTLARAIQEVLES